MANYKMDKGNMYIINGEKLERIFEARGLIWSELSKQYGMNPSYFHHSMTRNRLKKSATMWLEKEYGILLEDYVVFEEEPKTELPELTPTEELVADWQVELCGQIKDLAEKIEEINVKLENLPNMRFGNGQDSALNLTKDELMNVVYKAVYSAVKHAWENV